MATGTTLVTGGTGFAGGHLLDVLGDDAPMVAWHRAGRVAPAPRPGVTWSPVNLLDRAAVTKAIREVQPARIFHLAGAPNVDTAWKNVLPHLETNVLGTHHVLDAVREFDAACRVLVVTSAMIYEAADAPIDEDTPLIPSSPYGLSKLAQDQLALRAHLEDGLDIVIARPFNHAGPRQDAAFAVSSFARQIAMIEAGHRPAELHVGNLDARRDLTDVRDVVAAYVCLMNSGRGGQAYNVCAGRAHRIGDLLDALLEMSNTPITVVQDAARLRPSDTPIVLGCADRIRDETGWVPSRPIEQTLEDTLQWWRSRGPFPI